LQLKRTISLNTAIAIVVGGIIGSGIFMKPSVMAMQLGSPALLLSVWVVAGIITLFGALSNAEVAAMFPETGGQYVFFQKMYGGFFSFLYGWAAFAVFNTAGNASIAYVCAYYANFFIPLHNLDPLGDASIHISLPGIGKIYFFQDLGIKLFTIILIGLFTYINYKSVQWGSYVQRLLTALKLVAIAMLIFGLLGSGKGDAGHFNERSLLMPHGWKVLGAYMAAVAGAFWAYDGWNNISFIAGEIKEPGKNISKSLFTGLLICITTYVLLNLALIYMMPVTAIASSLFVASDAAAIAWGTIGGTIITLMVILSTLGTTNSNVLATARLTCAWSKENKLFSRASVVHHKNQTPGNALILNAVWSCLLVMTGSFDMLTDMLVFVSWLFYMMSGIGLFVLRYKLPSRERPYKVWGYPVVPVIFIAFAALFLVVTIYTDITNYAEGKTTFVNSVFGLLITLAGVPFYFLSKRRKLQPGPAAQVSDTRNDA
jgi:APA family basic amino acid/polyamine antiporter